MRYMFTPSDETLPWAGQAVPIVPPLKMPMSALSEALTAKKWRLADLHDLLRRITLDSLERLAERQGKEYTGPPSGMTGDDDVVVNQLSAFGSLRAAGHRVTWEQMCQMPVSDFHVVAEDAADEAALAEYAVDDGDDADPQSPSTDSAPAVDDATEPTSEASGPR